MASTALNVKILSPTQTIFEGEALSVSSLNSTGKFDILPYHANYITLVQKNPIILRIRKKREKEQALPSKALEAFFGSDFQEVKYDFDTAIIYAKDNNIKIYTDIQPQF